MNLGLLLSKIGISSNFVQDATLLVVIILLTIAFAFLIGRGRLISVLVSFYISLALLNVFPKEYLKDYSYELGLFFILLILIAIFSKRIFGIYISSSEFMWRIFAVSFLEVAMLFSLVFSILPEKKALGYISQNTYGYLVSSPYNFLWLIAPIIFVYLIRKRLN
ncbi:MAG: hypothetical protein A2271_01425 [Candidatus Moranbacteria bacterium RIFOXYA12_FULL_35_19]|nr:MAG: hypothetical protein UR78_C0012G0044 [Candidatus Moranbacteria bacterium GW2011_GWF2_35_39]OGI31939.1 MAG: hypothetical protein A2343_02970 [Candidatus Moranbacteria bacterium RIFOXYB12_FULL_35_8]OGI32930.1 MAG: hypothetical protein A2489_00755 [Candidatus Moranbacteria bacterium RIFOXYC12_FULL_36_13]OGI35949.1 MAG: hypothetical protein A2271_01425 [Candidatus Moranbacteria bacterium RIFOXYA12_FULL_35_19]